MKKFSQTLVAFAVMSLAGAGYALAAEKAEAKVAGCCVKAQTAGNACTHPCCVEAAKTGDNCAKCGGSGKIAKKSEAKK